MTSGSLETNCLAFYKIKPLIEQYAGFWGLGEDFSARNVFELGIWDGGSVAFWFECFQPEKLVAIDRSRRGNSRYFQKYIDERGIRERVNTYWGVDQRDSKQLRGILGQEFSGPLDLVIDDASHMYRATKMSFEVLFPCLRPGGFYIIEDWAWAHWQEFQSPLHPTALRKALTQLVFELVEAVGSCPWLEGKKLIERVVIFQGFAAIERGDIPLPQGAEFRLFDYIRRRPLSSIARKFLRIC